MTLVETSPLEDLGLVGDGDEADLLADIERSFEVRFGEEARAWRTVGDIHKALLARLPPGAEGKCATSMAFYRLRRSLERLGAEPERIAPSTPLATLTRLPSTKLYAALERDLGVASIPVVLSTWGFLALIGLAGSVLAALATWSAWPLALAAACAVVVRRDGGGYYGATVGDLARRIATDNFRSLAEAGADTRPAAVWRTLTAIVAADLSGAAAGRVAPGTLLFPRPA